jgi:hypothetical protein
MARRAREHGVIHRRIPDVDRSVHHYNSKKTDGSSMGLLFFFFLAGLLDIFVLARRFGDWIMGDITIIICFLSGCFPGVYR